jgi:hypothetical protein
MLSLVDDPYFCEIFRPNPRRRCPYFDVVAGLAWSEDPESYADGRAATGGGSHAGQVKGDDSDRKGYLAFQVGG